MSNIRHVKQGHVTYCKWCKVGGRKTICTHHLTGANMQSCLQHLSELQAIKAACTAIAERRTEADEQTWMRL